MDKNKFVLPKCDFIFFDIIYVVKNFKEYIMRKNTMKQMWMK